MNIIWSKVCIISQSVGRRNYRGAAAGAVPVQFLISSAAWEHVNRPRRVCSLHPAALQHCSQELFSVLQLDRGTESWISGWLQRKLSRCPQLQQLSKRASNEG